MLSLKRVASIIIALLIVTIILILIKPTKITKNNKLLNEILYKNNEANYSKYYGRIEINKIGLYEYFYEINDKRNNVDKGIEVLKPSIMPDKDNSKLFLASHSGNSKISYFKNIDKLEYNDDVIIYLKNKCYKYKVIDKYEIIKNGTLDIREIEDNTLILITCVRDTNRQLIIICKLI